MFDLNAKEVSLLRPYIRALEKLEQGKIEPKTALQKHFLAMCRGESPARTEYEFAYLKWRRTKPDLSKVKQNGMPPKKSRNVRLKDETKLNQTELKKIALQVKRRVAADIARQKSQAPTRTINEFGSREDWKKDRASWIKRR